MAVSDKDLPTLGLGFYWQDLAVGQRFRTFARTITEADLVGFIACTGFVEVIFTDARYEGAAMKGRAVPGALTYSMIEGLLMQTMIQGTGLAMLELHQEIHAPVLVGDNVWATVEVTEIRPTAKNNRAVVISLIRVFNHRDEPVMTYTAKRLLAGRPA
jgi:acyl dehydratase